MRADRHHRCASPRCDRVIPRGIVLCGPCWARLPYSLRTEITRSWHEGRIADFDAAWKVALHRIGVAPGTRRQEARW